MTVRYLAAVVLALAGASTSQAAFTLDFGTNPWTGGSGTLASTTYNDVGGSGVNITINLALSGGAYANTPSMTTPPNTPSPVVSDAANGSAGSAEPSLFIGVNFTSNNTATSNIVVTVTFSEVVANLNFRIFDIDLFGSQWRDRVILSGTPTLTAFPSPSYVVNGSTISGTASANDNLDNGTVGVAYTGLLSSFSFIYTSAPGAQANPLPQAIGLSDLNFDMAPTPVPPTALAGLLGVGLFGVARRRIGRK